MRRQSMDIVNFVYALLSNVLCGRALAQSAIRLQEIHQSLRANVYDVAHEMQINHVSRSIQQLRKSNAVVQKQLQTLKQRVCLVYIPIHSKSTHIGELLVGGVLLNPTSRRNSEEKHTGI